MLEMSMSPNIYDRAQEISNFILLKYVHELEEIMAREAKLVSKPELSPEDKVELAGIRAMKRIIAEELGIPIKEFNPEEEKSAHSILDIMDAFKDEEIALEA